MMLAQEFNLGISITIVYGALVRPMPEYGCVVWGPHTALDSWRES